METGGKSSRHGTATGLAAKWRILLSGLIVLQIAAIVAEPFRFFTLSSRGTSPISDPAREFLAAYIEFAYLNHGYFFFAPEPGPSHLVECRFELADGSSARLRFPDRQAQWPRLLYHRHFMLSENLHQLWTQPFQPELLGVTDPQVMNDWKRDRARFEAVRDSMARHIAFRYDARDVQLDRIEHRLPSDDEVFRQRVRLNDRRLYITLPDAPLNPEFRPFGVPPDSMRETADGSAVLPAGAEAAQGFEQLEAFGEAASGDAEETRELP